MNRVRELLFGVVALQKGLATLRQVMDGLAAQRDGSLGDFLLKLGVIDAGRRKEIDDAIDAAVSANSGDEQATLQHMQTDERILIETLGGAVIDNEPTAQSHRYPALGIAPLFAETWGRYEWAGSTELGRGGTGRVAQVWDTSMGREVAVKQLLVKTDSAKLRIGLEARFLREARLTGQLEHPAVLAVHEVGRQEDGGLYYSMQRVRGRTLHEALHAAPTVPQRLALLPHFLTLCQAMAYAHSRGVIHRDLKPHNVMIGDYGETYLLDWGLARVKGKTDFAARERAMMPDLTGNVLEGRAIGTPPYMSPEQAAGRMADIDERSDVWGLGAVLYELVSARTPYTGVNPMTVLASVLHDPVPPLEQVQPDVPPELGAVAMKCLSRDPAQRYKNAREVAAEIDAWMHGRRVQAHDYNARELLQRFMKKNRKVTSVAAIALVVTSVFGAVSVQRIKRERDAAKDLAQMFLDDVAGKLEPLPGSRPLLEQLTTQTLQHYQQSVDPLAGPEGERRRLGWAWQRIGRLTYKVGKTAEAERAFRFARTVAGGLVKDNPNDWDAQVLDAEGMIGLADVVHDRGDLDQAEGLFLRATELAQAASYAQGEHLKQAFETLSRSTSRLGSMYDRIGRSEEALQMIERSIAVDDERAQHWPDDRLLRHARGMGAVELAQLHLGRGDLEKARKAFERVRELGRSSHLAEPGNADLASMYAYGLLEVARFDAHDGKGLGEADVKAADAVMRRLLADDPDNLEFMAEAIEVSLALGDDAQAWKVASRMFELATMGENLPSALLAGFATGHHVEVVRASRDAAGVSKLAAGIFGAMSAAATGDTALAVERSASARANVAEISTLAWVWKKTDQNVSGPHAEAIHALCAQLDDVYWSRDRARLTAALETFEAALK